MSEPDWEIDALDLGDYLARIGHEPVRPSAAALASLHEAHVRAIPFENIDVLLAPHPGLDLKVIQEKLVHRRRGGYCYEHALLFAAALEQLGFDVRRRVARVFPDELGPLSHMMLIVRVDGIDYLADVGFGTGLLRPMPLIDGVELDQGGWPHRITQNGPQWTLWRRALGEWKQLHATDDLPRFPVDYKIYHHYVSTHPDSPFTGQLVVMRTAPGRSTRLVGTTLTVEKPDGSMERRTVTLAELEPTLRELDIELTTAEADALRAYVGTHTRKRVTDKL